MSDVIFWYIITGVCIFAVTLSAYFDACGIKTKPFRYLIYCAILWPHVIYYMYSNTET